MHREFYQRIFGGVGGKEIKIMDTRIFTRGGKYLMLALDHRGSFKKYVRADASEAATDDEVTAVKAGIINATRADFSGVLIDPAWGLPAYSNPDRPFLLCLEKTGYTEEAGERLTELEYDVRQLKQWGASGAKLLLYFNPEGQSYERQLSTARRALEDAHAAGLPLFLEIVTYGNEVLGKPRFEWVLRSVRACLDGGIRPDVFKLEYPGDKKSCAEITRMLGDIPWILLTRGETFRVFKKQLKRAVAAGAVGFLAGRAIWQEIGKYTDPRKRQKFLDTKVRKRFKKVCEIALRG